jgi:hypothetical protein
MMMVYEARHSAAKHWALAGACLLLSIIGFAAAGVIPTESGSNPVVGWAIVIACFAAALVFVRRAVDRSVQVRVDEKGVYSRRVGGEPVPWADIAGSHVLAAGIQRIARFDRRGGKTFGINTTFYDRGIGDLRAAVRHHRPDLNL